MREILYRGKRKDTGKDEIVPGFRAKIEELETQHRTEYCEAVGYDCVELGRARSKPKTKGDRIRAMPDDELAWELMTWRCEAVARHHGVESDFPDTQKSILATKLQPNCNKLQPKGGQHGQAEAPQRLDTGGIAGILRACFIHR